MVLKVKHDGVVSKFYATSHSHGKNFAVPCGGEGNWLDGGTLKFLVGGGGG